MEDRTAKNEAIRAFNNAKIKVCSTNEDTYKVVALDSKDPTILPTLEDPYNVCFKPRGPEYLVNLPTPLTQVDQGILTVMGSEYCGLCWGSHKKKDCPELAKGWYRCSYCGIENAHLSNCCLRDEGVDRYRMNNLQFYDDWDAAPH